MPFNGRKQTAKAILNIKKIQDTVQMISLWLRESSFNRQYTIWSHMTHMTPYGVLSDTALPRWADNNAGISLTERITQWFNVYSKQKQTVSLLYCWSVSKAYKRFCTNFLPSRQALSQGHGRQKWILEQGVQQNVLFLINRLQHAKANVLVWSLNHLLLQ